jgi:hypothetical protein
MERIGRHLSMRSPSLPSGTSLLAGNLAALAALGILLLPATATGQTSADSLAVLEAAVVQWLGEEAIGNPMGGVETICLDSPGVMAGSFMQSGVEERDARALSEPVSAASLEFVGTVLERATSATVGSGCTIRRDEPSARLIDDSGAPALRFQISGPAFETPDSALVSVGYLSGALGGGGYTCRWRRTGDETGWEAAACLAWWDS